MGPPPRIETPAYRSRSVPNILAAALVLRRAVVETELVTLNCAVATGSH